MRRACRQGSHRGWNANISRLARSPSLLWPPALRPPISLSFVQVLSFNTRPLGTYTRSRCAHKRLIPPRPSQCPAHPACSSTPRIFARAGFLPVRLGIARTSEAKGLTCAVNRLDVLCVGLCHLLLQCLQPFDLWSSQETPYTPTRRKRTCFSSGSGSGSDWIRYSTCFAFTIKSDTSPSCLLKDVSMSHSRHARVRV